MSHLTDAAADRKSTEGLRHFDGQPPEPVRSQRRRLLLIGSIVAIAAVALVLALRAQNDKSVTTQPSDGPTTELVSLGLLLNDLDGSRPPTWSAIATTAGTGADTVFSLAFRDAAMIDQAQGEVRRIGTGNLRVPSDAEFKQISQPCGGCVASAWTTPGGEEGFQVALDGAEAIVVAHGVASPSIQDWFTDLLRKLDS